MERKRLLRGLCLAAACLMLSGIGGTGWAEENPEGNPPPAVLGAEGGETETESPSPSPEESESPSPAPEESESPSPAPEESESPTPSPEETESPTPSPEETESPTPSPEETESPTPSPEETESPTPSPEETESPTPGPEESPQSIGEPASTLAPAGTEESLFEIQDGVLTGYRGKGQHRSIKIPPDVRTIARDVFRDDPALQQVVLPDSVETIEENAFAGCGRLKEIVLSSGSGLRRIGNGAFQDCEKLERETVQRLKEIAGEVAAEAFRGVPGAEPAPQPDPQPNPDPAPQPNPEPEPNPNPAPQPEPKPNPDPAPQPNPQPNPEPAPQPDPQPNPEQNPDPAPEEGTEETGEELEEDPFAGIEWEEPAPAPASGGSGKPRQTHGRSRYVMTHDYDQVDLPPAEDGEQAPMHVLKLGDEELALSLEGPEGTEGRFTAALRTEGPDSEGETAETLLLCAVPPEAPEGDAAEMLRSAVPPEDPEGERDAAFVWRLNGSVLRTLNRSGVRYLALQAGGRRVSVPTEGFLAGWEYDEMKSRGTASRRFEYTLTVGSPGGEAAGKDAEGEDAGGAEWTVTVEGKEFRPGTDPLSGMYLRGVTEKYAPAAEAPEETPEENPEDPDGGKGGKES